MTVASWVSLKYYLLLWLFCVLDVRCLVDRYSQFNLTDSISLSVFNFILFGWHCFILAYGICAMTLIKAIKSETVEHEDEPSGCDDIWSSYSWFNWFFSRQPTYRSATAIIPTTLTPKKELNKNELNAPNKIDVHRSIHFWLLLLLLSRFLL